MTLMMIIPVGETKKPRHLRATDHFWAHSIHIHIFSSLPPQHFTSHSLHQPSAPPSPFDSDKRVSLEPVQVSTSRHRFPFAQFFR